VYLTHAEQAELQARRQEVWPVAQRLYCDLIRKPATSRRRIPRPAEEFLCKSTSRKDERRRRRILVSLHLFLVLTTRLLRFIRVFSGSSCSPEKPFCGCVEEFLLRLRFVLRALCHGDEATVWAFRFDRLLREAKERTSLVESSFITGAIRRESLSVGGKIFTETLETRLESNGLDESFHR
jgi:hypothetical protein